MKIGRGPVIALGFIVLFCADCGGGNGGGTPTIDNYFAYFANGVGKIYAAGINPNTGALTEIAGSPFNADGNPTSIAVEPSGKFIYAASPTTGTVSAYSINPSTGALTKISGSPFSDGGYYQGYDYPHTVAIDPAGKFLYVTIFEYNYVASFSINSATGAMNKLGSGGPPFFGPTGYQPCAIAIDPTGKFAYVVNNGSGDVTASSIDPTTGALTEMPGSPFAAGAGHFSVNIDATGKFLYLQHINEVSAYSIDPTTGALTEIAGSPFAASGHPYYNSVVIDPTGKFIYMTDADYGYVYGFGIDPATGALTGIVGSPFALGTYGAIGVDPAGKFLYLCLWGGDVSGYIINPSTGALTQIAGSPFLQGAAPFSIATVHIKR